MKFSGFHRKNRRQRREGASLVSVVLGILFLSAIGGTIMTTATRYAVSVYTTVNSSDNFYESESILAEVRTGLIEYASSASKAAYEEELQRYMEDGVNAKLKYSERYMNGLVAALTGKSSFNVAAEVNKDTPHKSYKAEVGAPLAQIKKLTQKPDAVKTGRSTKMGYYDFDIQYDKLRGYTLILRNLDIDYTNGANYRSQITTDVVFTTPDYKFDGDSTFDELKNYLVVADGILKRSDVNKSTGTTSLTGNIYTGAAPSKTSTDKPEVGIEIGNEKKVVFNSDRIISRGDLDIRSGSDIVINGDAGQAAAVAAGDLWLQNIRLRNYNGSKLGSKLKLYENAYISNDLDIEDDNSEIYLAGTYYGYSYNEKNVADPSGAGATNAEYSSAVLVNGLNTGLYTDWDPSKDNTPAAAGVPTLEKMVLAGHTFVERDTSIVANLGDDIVMGESIAAKSDQIAYMVPDDYIAGLEHNPIFSGEYANKNALLENVKLALNNSPLKDYLKTEQPYIENHVQMAEEDVMYLFLNFKNMAMANRYFYEYFAGGIQEPSVPGDEIPRANRDMLKERAHTYLRATNINATFSPNLYLLAGYIAYNYDETEAAKGIQSPKYFQDTGNGIPKEELLQDARKLAKTYFSYCMNLTSSSVGGGEVQRVKGAEERLVAHKILAMDELNISKVKKNLSDSSKILVEAVTGNYNTGVLMNVSLLTGNERGILVASGDVVVDKAFRGIVVAGGKVTVKADFDGLILAQDHVEIVSDRQMTANILVVSELLEHVKKDPALAAIFNALNGGVTVDATQLEQCITYQNWLKDAGTTVE